MERRKRVARVRTQLVKEQWMYCKTQKIDETERAAEFARSLYYEITGDELRCSTKEVLIVCCVDAAYRPLTVEYVSVGTSDSTIVGIKEVFMTAILSNADGIFVFHNHPSGDPHPSIADGLMTQKIREAERAGIQELYGDKQDELLIGTVDLEDTDNYYINLGKINGVLPKRECIPGENIVMGSQLKVYVTKVDLNSKGMLVLLSRTHYAFLKRLFEIEIPEINDGTILVHSVARDAGSRSKVAVSSINDRIDPIGSCIGEKGSRIANILKEINGEKIDIVKYDSDPAVFIENALAPAKNLKVLISDPKKNEAMVIADKENFTLAIGKKGQNARLASRLTKYKIDIKTVEDASNMGISFREE